MPLDTASENYVVETAEEWWCLRERQGLRNIIRSATFYREMLTSTFPV